MSKVFTHSLWIKSKRIAVQAVMRSSAFRSPMIVFCTMETLWSWRNLTALFFEYIFKPLVPTGRFNPKTKSAKMLLTSNAMNLTAKAQQNSFCVAVDSPAENISNVCAYSFANFTVEFLRERIHNHHRLKTPRFTQDSQLFHREHGLLRFDIRDGGIPFWNN